MKKFVCLSCVFAALLITGCQTQSSPYDREDPEQTYERYINSHVFAACNDIAKPYATYSLANLNKEPSDDNPYYKVTFINGPCKGKVLWTKDVIVKTESAQDGFLEIGEVVLRNYHNPKNPEDKDLTDRWHKAVVTNTDRQNRGIVTLGFPRDENDFNPARESVYIHNVRHILQPQVKDIRTFL